MRRVSDVVILETFADKVSSLVTTLSMLYLKNTMFNNRSYIIACNTKRIVIEIHNENSYNYDS